MSNVDWLYSRVTSTRKDDLARRIAMLYGFETQGGRTSDLVQHPDHSVEPSRFADWLRRKVFINAQNLLAQKKWLKEGDHGHTFVISFLPDGTLVEAAAGNQDCTWKGTWALTRGVLRLHLGDYISDYLAKSNNRLTGAEERRLEVGFNAYFALKPLGARPHKA